MADAIQWLILATLTGPVFSASTIKCAICTNYLRGEHYDDLCPKDDLVDFRKVYFGDCKGCFTTLDPNNTSVVRRGCVEQMSLPLPLPQKDDCYDWNGVPFCLCRTSNCNAVSIGVSTGVRLDDHLQKEDNETDEVDLDGPLQCYQCSNYDEEGKEYKQCPKNHRVNPMIVYRGNCTGSCYTSSDPKNTKRVFRGCTDQKYGMPEKLPKKGCYDWNGAVFCVCNRHSCNGRPIGKSSGKDLDYLLDLIDDVEIVEKDGLRRCYQCVNYDAKGNYHPQCPKDKSVRKAFLDVCNGTCFTRTYDYEEKKVARGCTDMLYQGSLPNPLPPDGCYSYYSDVWCVCSNSRCNRRAIGKSSGVEFDAHIKKDGGGGGAFLQPVSALLVVMHILAISFSKFFLIK